MSKARKGLEDEANEAGREMSAATVMFHTVLAARRGLTASEEKALDILLREGPMSHAELVSGTGLAPASVSDLIDRLERRGYAERRPHPEDGRRVLVAAQAERVYADMVPLFADWVETLGRVYARYDDEQLGTIVDFLREVAVRQREATKRLSED